MKFKYLAILFAALSSAFMMSCEEDMSPIGGSLVQGEVTIIVDSIPTYVPATTVKYDSYDARSTTKLIGRINVPEYGSLNCSFLAALFPSPELNIPDTVSLNQVDSMRMVFTVPRGSLTGDSLAPQQLKVYKLNRQLPSDISSNADPSQYYSRDSLLGTKSYTLSALHLTDSAYKKVGNILIPVTLPKKMAQRFYTLYKETPEIFQWPSTFAKEFPGIYVEQNFGNGCIANISNLGVFLYYQSSKLTTKRDSTGKVDSIYVTKRDSTCLFASAPEVVSSNVIDFKVSDKISALVEQGKSVITTPGGYYVDIRFPAREIIDKYKENATKLTVISNLSMRIPAEVIENDYGLGAAPNLLMVKKSEMAEFFQKNRIPDGVTSFYAPYDSENKCYSFNTLRSYILSLIESGKEITDDDIEFSLVPVNINTEIVENYGSSSVYVTRCSNYITKPTMMVLDTDKAIVKFTYSKQEIE